MGLKARDIVGDSMLQFVVHVPVVLFLVWLLNHTRSFTTGRRNAQLGEEAQQEIDDEGTEQAESEHFGDDIGTNQFQHDPSHSNGGASPAEAGHYVLRTS